MAEEHPPDWPKIVERHAERVFRTAYRILGSVHDAEDVSQLVFPKQEPSGIWANQKLVRALLHVWLRPERSFAASRRKSIEIDETQYVSNLEPHHPRGWR